MEKSKNRPIMAQTNKSDIDQRKRQPYAPPELRRYGAIADVTKGSGNTPEPLDTVGGSYDDGQ
ncbi:lasso RiPP family leader peptide-containing protein [Pseudomonadota bacterium]